MKKNPAKRFGAGLDNGFSLHTWPESAVRVVEFEFGDKNITILTDHRFGIESSIVPFQVSSGTHRNEPARPCRDPGKRYCFP